MNSVLIILISNFLFTILFDTLLVCICSVIVRLEVVVIAYGILRLAVCTIAEICASCKIAIGGESGVRYQRVYGKVERVNTKCSGLHKYSSNVMGACNFLG